MSYHKFGVGDVVRLNDGLFKENNGKLATVKSVWQTDGKPYDVLKLETVGGWRLEVWEYMVVGVSLEEVQRYYADKPRRGFIVDGLTVDDTLVDELESGQDEAYVSFQRAAKEAEAVNELREKRARRDLITMIVFWIAANLIAMLAWLVCLDRLEETMPALIGMYSTVMGVLSVIEMALMTGAWRKREED
jgi:hypothetical protein